MKLPAVVDDTPIEPTGGSSEAAPFVYEIRIKGRLSNDPWTAWFEQCTITTAKGESILRGRAPDHAALYGLLGRLRDLAVPLVAVRVLDSEAQARLGRRSRRYDLLVNGLMVAVYLLLLGGLATLTVLAAHAMNVALALTILFAAVGALAHAFWLWSGDAPWRWAGYAGWTAAAITFLVFIPLSGLLPTTLGLAIMLFLLAGGVLYGLFVVRRHAQEVRQWLVRAKAEEAPLAQPQSGAGEGCQSADGPQE